MKNFSANRLLQLLVPQRLRTSRPRRLRRGSAIAAIVLVPIFGSAFLLQQSDTIASARLLDQVLQLTATRYVDTVSTNALYEKAARGLVRELNDPYSVLFSPKELEQFNQQTGGKYGGVGMEIAEIQGFVTVQRVFPNTPAAAAGVLDGDKIIQIDTFNVRGWTTQQVSEKLKGTPGTKVSVKFARTNVAEPIPVTFTRAIVHIPAVPYALIFEGDIGYVVLQQFSETATEELNAAINDLVERGAKKLVVDLRSNPGGILDEAIKSSNLFFGDGLEVASVRGRGGAAQVYQALDRAAYPDIPLVVMIDGRSASASEILAGSLQDHDRALIVGTTSFGKGLVQSLFQLDGGYALKMTTAKWYTPSGRSIQKDRKLLPDGELVEVLPDSMESDSVKKARPQFKSDAGRVVYGGGGITPDLIVKPDTLSTAEQKLFASFATKQQILLGQLQEFAASLKGKISPDFEVTPEMRAEFVKRLRDNGVTVDDALLAEGGQAFDHFIGARIATSLFGDSTAKRKYLSDDNQLVKAINLLKGIGERIDRARMRRPGNISRNTWITEAILEKLERDEQREE
jgi:carboxyl-terminal processing protease